MLAKCHALAYGINIVAYPEYLDDQRTISDLYNNVQKIDYPINAPLEVRPWGLTDFRLLDPDGYYLRITSKA
ncbi:hypothetical protein MM817_03222 [Acidibacillus sp. S0AB]|uniref:Glyoxalase/fosfomycin resistance/dioxygenase domain-containing protein n=1 Tax=Sulfoacidibacillus ferrooxidans TaxID=2005001 RepID=A0A9X1VCQ7_9BACL|nr:hypothetical protein [Sulfoacidibacillus ferrooxidans]